MSEIKIGYAKQHLSEVIRSCAAEPQVIYNRDRPVAALIDAAELEEFLAWRASRKRPALADRLAEVRRICAEEDYTFEAPPRLDRPNPLLPKPRAPRRHQRP